MKFLKSIFGPSAEKHEEKGDDLRFNFEFRDAAYYYRQALDALDPKEDAAAERLRAKLREVRRQAVLQLLDEAGELAEKEAPELAQEKLELARNFADDESTQREIERRLEELTRIFGSRDPEPPAVEEVSATDEELFELALTGYEPADRERALAMGEPFRRAFELCQGESWDQARGVVDGLFEDHPEEPLLLELAGMIAEGTGDLEGALGFWGRAHEIDPTRPGVIQGLASLHRREHRPQAAREILAQAVASRPPAATLGEAWVPVYLEHALLLSEDGHHQHAVSAAAALLDVPSADKGLVLYNLAGILERAGRDEDCRSALLRAIELVPRRALYRERLADFLIDRQIDLDMALAMLVSANEADTTGGPGGTLGGGVAARALKSPHRARYLYKMARIYFLKGEDLEAGRTIATALAVSRDPEVTRALEALRQELKEAGSRS